jgi:aryl-alcohol dehydrogenase-like predicted oxidoreductase
MGPSENHGTDRRKFLQAGALATASALSVTAGTQAQEVVSRAPELPKRKLGKTGIELTILEQGAVRSPDRVLRLAFADGIRVFDTAKLYGTEPNFKKWFEQDSSVRKQIIVVTKDMPRTPEPMMRMVDERLKALGTDYIDLFFLHGLGDGNEGSVDRAIKLVKSKSFKEVADKIRKSGKARFIGFSTHHKDRGHIIQAAAEGGAIDAIMLQYRPWLAKDSVLNKALDTCWNKGVGLISMKQIAGMTFGDRPTGDILKEVVEKVPMLAERKLTPFQGLLHAIWSDERITAACVSMKNTDQVRENADAARRFKPLEIADIHQLRDAAIAHGQMMCADCDGRCSIAAGTKAELGDLTRFLTYHQQHGYRADARRQYAALHPEARDWSGADLEAARQACPNRLDFAKLLPLVEKHLA